MPSFGGRGFFIRMWEWISNLPYLIIAALVLIFFVVMILVSLLEKQRIRQLEAVSRESLGPTSSYFNAMNEAAAAHGFTPCGAYARILKSSLNNPYMSAWLSPDRTTLACVLGGKVAKTNYRKSLMISWVGPEKFLVTRDDFGEGDHSNTMDIEVVLNADFQELAARHAQRFGRLSQNATLLEPGKVLMYWERMEEIRAQKLVRMGLARFQDEPNGVWRYTLKGGWMNFMDVVTGIKAHKQYADRLNKKRPGS